MGFVFLSIKLSRVADMFREASDLVRLGKYDEADAIMRRAIQEAGECPTYMSYLLPRKPGKKRSDAYGGPMAGE